MCFLFVEHLLYNFIILLGFIFFLISCFPLIYLFPSANLQRIMSILLFENSLSLSFFHFQVFAFSTLLEDHISKFEFLFFQFIQFTHLDFKFSIQDSKLFY